MYHAKEGTYTKGDYYAKAALTILYENAYATRTIVKDVSGEQYPWNSYAEYEAYASSIDWNKQNEINALAEQIRPNCPTCQNIILIGNDYVVPQYRYLADNAYQPTDKPYSGVSSLAQPIKDNYTTIYNIAPLGYNVTGIGKFQTETGRNITTSQRNAEDLACSQLSELNGLVVLYGTPDTNHLLKDCFSEEKVDYFNNHTVKSAELSIATLLQDTVLFDKGAYLPAGKTKTVLIMLADEQKTAETANILYLSAIKQGQNIRDAVSYIVLPKNTTEVNIDKVIFRDVSGAKEPLGKEQERSNFATLAALARNSIDTTKGLTVGCILGKGEGKAAFTGEVACNIIPVVELIPDIRDTGKCVLEKQALYYQTFGKPLFGTDINDPAEYEQYTQTLNGDNLMNELACQVTYIATAYDLSSYTTVIGTALATGGIGGVITLGTTETVDSGIALVKTILKKTKDIPKETIRAFLLNLQKTPEMANQFLQLIAHNPTELTGTAIKQGAKDAGALEKINKAIAKFTKETKHTVEETIAKGKETKETEKLIKTDDEMKPIFEQSRQYEASLKETDMSAYAEALSYGNLRNEYGATLKKIDGVPMGEANIGKIAGAFSSPDYMATIGKETVAVDVYRATGNKNTIATKLIEKTNNMEKTSRNIEQKYQWNKDIVHVLVKDSTEKAEVESAVELALRGMGEKEIRNKERFKVIITEKIPEQFMKTG